MPLWLRGHSTPVVEDTHVTFKQLVSVYAPSDWKSFRLKEPCPTAEIGVTSGHRDDISFHPSQTEAHLEYLSFSDNESKAINLEEVAGGI